MAPAQHVVGRAQMAAPGSCARKAAVPRGPPPTHQPPTEGGKRQLEECFLRKIPHAELFTKRNLPPPLKTEWIHAGRDSP